MYNPSKNECLHNSPLPKTATGCRLITSDNKNTSTNSFSKKQQEVCIVRIKRSGGI